MNFKKFTRKITHVIILMIIKLEDFDFDNIWINEKSNENILIYDISYKTLIGVKPLHIRFDKIDEKYDAIYNRIRYLIESKKWYCICYFS